MVANPIFDLKNNRDKRSVSSCMDFLWCGDGEVTPEDIAFLGFDCETTGLDADVHSLIQIGLVAFTSDYTPVAYFESVVLESFALERYRGGKVSQKVRKMHSANGLWNKLESIEDAGGEYRTEYTPKRVEQRAIAWLEDLGIADKRLPMLGSSVTFDRKFLDNYMPDLHRKFHYRSVDASSVVTVASHAAGVDEASVKTLADENRKGPEDHTSVSDILTSAANIVAAVGVIRSTADNSY
jgi:oligoribonuclease (3'-5' exoribonuclease)